MSLFEYMEEHEQIKNLHDRINNLKSIEKAHQKFNGELREEVKEFKQIVKALEGELKIKDREIGRMMGKINRLESKLR